ncbi:MAG: AAA family ATPase [Planctomycetota bacterium]|nr:MAG: AAA family ATPase [Planctomycetota bacterium]
MRPASTFSWISGANFSAPIHTHPSNVLGSQGIVADTDADQTQEQAQAQPLDGGTYEVIRRRLEDQAQELRTRVGTLNQRRQEIFGGTETTLLHTHHVQTQHNCIARDITRTVGNALIFGYQVHLGLKKETAVSDVFAKFILDDGALAPAVLEALNDPSFVKDFSELFQYYKDARLLQLRRTDTHLLMIFQTGARAGDIKVLRWSHDNDELRYIDNRGERDHTFPPRHSWEWQRCTREMHVYGQHAHINIDDTIFVECTRGDLTIKVENNTDSGDGIFSEPVDNATQGLDDAQISYAHLESCIILRIRPYQETVDRYIVYNKQSNQAVRLDSVGISCQELPEGHGLIFPNGYYLSTGEHKTFPQQVEGMVFVRAIRSPNGEDIIFVFHNNERGNYILLQYNLINRSVANPILCSGYAFYPDGRMILFRADDAPTRTHTMQIWQTPFESEAFALSKPRGSGSHLQTIGNRDLVRAISDILHICRLVADQKPSQVVYEDLLATITRCLDIFHWLGHNEACGLRQQLLELHATADQVIGEFEKVREMRQRAASQVAALQEEVDETLRQSAVASYDHIDDFVTVLASIRRRRGQVASLREVRYADPETLDAMDQQLTQAVDERSQTAVTFLLAPESMQPYHNEVGELEASVDDVDTTAGLTPLSDRLNELGSGLDMLMEIVGGLDIDDPTARTEILERISEVYAKLNRAKAVVTGRRSRLGSAEGKAEFAAQYTILTQTTNNYLGLATSPEACDEFLGKLMIQLEELESRFIEFDAFAEKLAEKREEIYESFQGRKQSLLDDRQRTANSLARAASRILDGVRKRALAFSTLDDLNAWFAGDPMVGKLRDVVAKLSALGDSVKSDDIEGQLKAAREAGVRALRDQAEIFDGETVKLGRHRFSRNTQDLELTLLPREDGMCFHLSGTDYYQPVEDKDFLLTRPFWDQELVSENRHIYRSEYLAYRIIDAAERGQEDLSLRALHEAMLDNEQMLRLVRKHAGNHYDEGYERGIHDADAAAIIIQVIHLRETCGLLRFADVSRALGLLWWYDLSPEQAKSLSRRGFSLHRLQHSFGLSREYQALVDELTPLLTAYQQQVAIQDADAVQAARYLLAEIAEEPSLQAVISGEAEDCLKALHEDLDDKHLAHDLQDDLTSLSAARGEQWRLAYAWSERWINEQRPQSIAHIAEVAAALCHPIIPRRPLHARTEVTVEGLLGQHPRIVNGSMKLRIDAFEQRLGTFLRDQVPSYRAYQSARREIVSRERERLHLESFKPKVLTSFVRNKLINEAYLPLIGDNLAKQMGAVGDNKRTDLMGLLLLISPPGYGKTTLMEYVASILGLTFMKINGPSLGHEVTSLDPAQAGSATAAQELEKLNLSFEMGNNVMIYLDDIQHCHPELLQKFISLCDGQRRIEGVWRGRTRSYDLRGKKVAVVMAGNPYTETGERFQIPDMLANRADTYNLGDILGGHQTAFELSYLENCLTVNPVLAPVASRSQTDFYRLLRISEGEDELRSELEHPYSGVELEEICTVLKKLRRVQDVLLKVNSCYIHSASMADEYRTEPPFKLQGSYRNMAKLAEKIVAVMNDSELENTLLDHYQGEAQTLTNGAESNLLKLREITGQLDETQAARWQAIKRTYARRQELAGGDDDPMQRALMQLIKVNEQLGGIEGAITQAAGAGSSSQEQPMIVQALEGLAEVLQRSQDNNANEQSQALATAIDRLGTVFDVESKRPIQVINTLPKYYANLYRHHIEVIEKSIRPALEALGKHLSSSGEIRDNLQQLVSYLRTRIDNTSTAPSWDIADAPAQEIVADDDDESKTNQ